MCEREPARVATRVGLLQEFQVADDMLVKERLAFKVFQKVESDMRFMFLTSVGDNREITFKPDRVNIVVHGPQCRNHIVFGSPGLLLFFDAFGNCVWRHQFLRDQHDDSQFCFRFEFHSGIR